MRTPSVAFAAIILATALSACGSSSDSSGGETAQAAPSTPGVALPSVEAAPALSLQDFHAKAQAACQRLNDEVRALPQPATEDEVSTYVANIYGSSGRAVTTIKSLRPPAEQADGINRDFLHPLSDQLDAALAMPEAVSKGDKDREAELKKIATEARDRVNAYAANNDLTACVQAS